jgi:hypothetical protein
MPCGGHCPNICRRRPCTAGSRYSQRLGCALADALARRRIRAPARGPVRVSASLPARVSRVHFEPSRLLRFLHLFDVLWQGRQRLSRRESKGAAADHLQPHRPRTCRLASKGSIFVTIQPPILASPIYRQDTDVDDMYLGIGSFLPKNLCYIKTPHFI